MHRHQWPERDLRLMGEAIWILGEVLIRLLTKPARMFRNWRRR